MSGIFISYRRDDSAGHAGRLYDRLEREFPDIRVFMDVEKIAAGEDFTHVIDQTLRQCEGCLVVIGKRWLTTADNYGRRRLDKPDDWVRLEIGAALTRGVRVIPLLVDEASLPPPEALPPELARLSALQAHPVHHLSFHQDVGTMIARLRTAIDARRQNLAQAAQLAAGTVRVHPQDELDYVWIPPGEFFMGRAPGDTLADERYDDEKPRHPVRLTRGFWLARGPITVAAYKRFALAAGQAMPPAPKHNPGWSKLDHPVTNVTWAQARAYCAWGGGRLPSEAQWEYAARGGHADRLYPWGDTIGPADANYIDNHDWEGSTSPVGCFAPNGFNLVDMVGNVWEWIADWYDPEVYQSRSSREPTEDPEVYVDKLHKRVVRGAAWGSIAVEMRQSNRGFFTPADAVRDFGFRCLVDEIPAAPAPP
ncbi:SUMF1/EgtB/PvdO family nonheme iron enzyme [Denitromonas iodatirespirans]|uniref:SUMF1/EgtB/PvdO family nonheme iron enzyme n=1 Tax=Denitromonas iodatirespirans TaxID=2795389 RepID=A0A944DGB1_DENI1|nr:SUMF1/EgtB/PvdO family nonheme iron enzyme [Denitromonas iodatirespirans]MBT0963808.1 SUMF1/EgtB/PvdO family nonheme iron enzyme [Denitromonas iodatirespirans]